MSLDSCARPLAPFHALAPPLSYSPSDLTGRATRQVFCCHCAKPHTATSAGSNLYQYDANDNPSTALRASMTLRAEVSGTQRIILRLRSGQALHATIQHREPSRRRDQHRERTSHPLHV
jgi:hypothetical protein